MGLERMWKRLLIQTSHFCTKPYMIDMFCRLKPVQRRLVVPLFQQLTEKGRLLISWASCLRACKANNSNYTGHFPNQTTATPQSTHFYTLCCTSPFVVYGSISIHFRVVWNTTWVHLIRSCWSSVVWFRSAYDFRRQFSGWGLTTNNVNVCDIDLNTFGVPKWDIFPTKGAATNSALSFVVEPEGCHFLSNHQVAALQLKEPMGPTIPDWPWRLYGIHLTSPWICLIKTPGTRNPNWKDGFIRWLWFKHQLFTNKPMALDALDGKLHKNVGSHLQGARQCLNVVHQTVHLRIWPSGMYSGHVFFSMLFGQNICAFYKNWFLLICVIWFFFSTCSVGVGLAFGGTPAEPWWCPMIKWVIVKRR